MALELKLAMNEIHRVTGVSRGVIQKCVNAARAKGIQWPLPDDLDDKALEEQLFGHKLADTTIKLVEPDWNMVSTELRKPGVNRRLLWMEYIGNSPVGKYCYSQFNRRLKKWLKRQELSMRQEHKAGDKLFVDYAGQRVPVVIDRESGEALFAQIFVAVLGASNYTYIDASWKQDSRSWIKSHVRALEYLKGVPRCLVPDNLKSGVTEAEPFEPLLNETYNRLGQYYDCAIVPARSGHPKDKAKVEKGVQFGETWVLARLRNLTFFSLEQLNETIQELLIELNNEPFQKSEGTRYSLYQSIDLPALKPLPQSPFEFEEWLIRVKVEKDYHVCVTGHHYSVPHELRGERVDIRYTDDVVEILHNNIRVTSHPRNKIQKAHSTHEEHRPPQHALYAGASAENFLDQAAAVGGFTSQVITAIINAYPYPQLAFKQCFGILNSLLTKYGPTKLETACEYAVRIGSPGYRVVKAALESTGLPQQMTLSMIDSHENIRGPEEYCQQGETLC
jgi:transposase